MWVAIFAMSSGERVRNTWVICHEDRDNLLKGELIPDVVTGRHLQVTEVGFRKVQHFMMSPRPIR